MVSKKSLKPFFSIVTCTRNSAKFLAPCLDSVQSQSFRNFEHIIIDGNSTDATHSILNKFHLHPRAFSARGISAAMNEGIKRAVGEYIYFLHSDDSLYSPSILDQAHQFLVANPRLDWVYGRIHEVDESGKTVGFPPRLPFFHAPHSNLLKFYNYIPHQGVFMKKTVFDRFGGFDETLKSMMDDELWLRIANQTLWDYVPLIVANYSVRNDSQSESSTNRKSNTHEFESVQGRYLTPLELKLANLINKILR